MNKEVFEYIERVSKACCGQFASTLDTYKDMYGELRRLTAYSEGFQSKHLPKCIEGISEKVGKTYAECYEAFIFAEFYNSCSRCLPSVFALTSSVFERNNDYIESLKEVCSLIEDCANSEEEFKMILDRGVAITNKSSRAFLALENIKQDAKVIGTRLPYDSEAMENIFTRAVWVLDMLSTGERSRRRQRSE